jgi:hypothetical protein
VLASNYNGFFLGGDKAVMCKFENPAITCCGIFSCHRTMHPPLELGLAAGAAMCAATTCPLNTSMA